MPQDDTRKGSPDKPPEDIAAFERKLADARETEEARRVWKRDLSAPPKSALGVAFRVAVELVSALAVGFAIGWALDNWLGTSPWFMIVFMIMGACAGMLNVYRVAQRLGSGLGYQKTGPAPDNAENGGEAPREGRDRSG